MEYMIYGTDEKVLEDCIQEVIETQNRYKIEPTEIRPLEMEQDRETDLDLANIVIYKPDEQIDMDMYNHLINKKEQELSYDRLVQLNKEKQDNPDLYSLEKYFEEYENQFGKRLSEIQIQGVKNFESKIRTGLILGKYNLSDYITFLKSIPDLLSKKKAIAIGYYNGYGDERFCIHGEVDEVLSPEKVSQYNTYTYNRIKEMRLTNDEFKPIPVSIKKRMSPDAEPLCAVDIEEQQLFSPEKQEIDKNNPNTRWVGSGIMQRIYSDESGILFIGGHRVTIKEQKTGEVSYTPEEIAAGINPNKEQIEQIMNESIGVTLKKESSKIFEDK